MGIDTTLIIMREDIPIYIWPALDRPFERSILFCKIIDRSIRVGGVGDLTIDGYGRVYLMKYEILRDLVQNTCSYHFEDFPLEKIKPTDKIYFYLNQ
ncbi:MAG: hypothetical protein ACXAEU_14790 [Candidatus Hodarchaeales archaeon]|jgi:hypothetical protein